MTLRARFHKWLRQAGAILLLLCILIKPASVFPGCTLGITNGPKFGYPNYNGTQQ